jgi:hypothetical protein
MTILIKKIRDYIDQWNANSEPFAWTATADEILASVNTRASVPSSGDRTPALLEHFREVQLVPVLDDMPRRSDGPRRPRAHRRDAAAPRVMSLRNGFRSG